MEGLQQLAKLRSLGKLEQISACCHHLGFFNNVGLSATYDLSRSSSTKTFDLRRLIIEAVGDVVRKYRILSVIPVNEDKPDAYFASLPSVNLASSIVFLERDQQIPGDGKNEDKQLDALLQDQHNVNFKAGYGTLPFWRMVILYESTSYTKFTACFIYHHAIGDGISGVVFHKQFLKALESISASTLSEQAIEKHIKPDGCLSVLPPLEELHALPIDPNPGNQVAEEVKTWTGQPICVPCQSRWVSVSFSPGASSSFFLACKGNGVSVTSAVSSIIASALFSVLPRPNTLECIIPVNLRPWLKLSEATDTMGTYFDVTRARFNRSHHLAGEACSMNIWPAAQETSKFIEGYLQNVSPSGEPYTTVGIFKNIPDVSVVFNSMLGKARDAAFEVTNVGLFSSSCAPSTGDMPLWQVGKVMLSRSAAVSGAAITVSIATGGDGSMTVGFSWQDGVVDDTVLSHVKLAVEQYIGNYS